MANQNFRVKHGLEVGLGATILSATHDGKIGINQASPIATLDVNGNTELDSLNVSGVSTFVGNLKATHINISGVGTFPTLVSTNGTINYLETINADVTGIGSISKLQATNASIGVATITTIDVTGGDIEALTGANASISGIVTASEFKGDLTGNVTGALTGNADTATTLKNSRDFSVSGDVATASAVSFNGSSNVNLAVTLSNNFSAETTGIVTAFKFSTGSVGTGINIDTNTISGPSELILDPAGVGDDTGTVRIKGDLIVDGQQLIVDSQTITLGDFIIGIASTATSDVLADGAGIQIGPNDNTFTYDHTNTAFKSSENLNLAEGKSYKINGTDVLSYNTLGSTILNSSLTSVGTLGNLNVSGIVTATTFAGNLSGNVIGTADEAVTLQSIRNFSATGDVATTSPVGFDGSANVNLVLSLSNSFDANTSGIITAFKLDSDHLNVSGMATISQIHLGGLSPDGTTFGISNYVPVANGTGGWSWQPIAAAGGGSLDGISVLEEGTSVGAAGSIISVNFTGANVTATATGTSATITFSDSPTYQNIVSIESGDDTSGRLDLYCEVNNAHFTRLQAAPHVDYSGNATVILPVIDGTMIVGGTNSNTVDITTSGDITANSFVKSSGTSSQFLKADGSVDSSTYLTSYTETQTLDDVLTLGNTSSTGIQVGISTINNQLSITSSDGSEGRLDLYCEVNNAHYTRLQAAPHSSYSGNATVVVPNTSGTLLLTDGDGSLLTGIVTSISGDSGITVDESTGNVTISGPDLSSYFTEIVQDTTPQLGGDLDLNSNSITGTGNISITGIVTATDFNSSSDINLKNNVRLIEDPLSKVMSIRGVNFEWKQNSETSAGVIAQEIEEVMPELVNEVDGRKTVNYNGLIGLLVEVVKDQQKQIDELKEKLS